MNQPTSMPLSISKRIALYVGAAAFTALALSSVAGWWWSQGQGQGQGVPPVWQLLSALVLAQLLPCAVLMLMLAKLRVYAFGPQAQLVRQLTAVGEGLYEPCVQPPALEWAEPFRAANVMVARLLQRRLARDKQLSLLREEVATDSLTGLASRAQFMQTLGLALAREGAATLNPRAERGMVAIVRVHDLVGVNQRMGRERGDELLASIAMLLRMHLMRLGTADSLLARLNGADFAVIAPGVPELALNDWLEDLALGFTELHHNAVADRPHVAWLGATTFTRGEPLPDVMSRADAMVQSSESQQLPYRLTNAMESDHAIPTAQWRMHIERALDTGMVSLAYFPVLCADGRLLHREAVVRLTLADGAVMTGSKVVPPALRTGRIMDLDLRVIELALVELKADPQASDVAVNVSPQSLARPLFVERLGAVLAQAGSAASRLWIEVDESVLNNAAQDLNDLAALLKAHGTRLGIDHFQSQWTQAFELPQRGVCFVKLDASLCHGMAARLEKSPSGRDHAGVLRALLGSTDACHVIATGLRQVADVQAAWHRQLDAASGPQLSRQWAAQIAAESAAQSAAAQPLKQTTTPEKVEH